MNKIKSLVFVLSCVFAGFAVATPVDVTFSWDCPGYRVPDAGSDVAKPFDCNTEVAKYYLSYSVDGGEVEVIEIVGNVLTQTIVLNVDNGSELSATIRVEDTGGIASEESAPAMHVFRFSQPGKMEPVVITVN